MLGGWGGGGVGVFFWTTHDGDFLVDHPRRNGPGITLIYYLAVYSRDQRVCPLYLGSLTGDKKRHIFHCTNDKLVEIRKDFAKELYESNLKSCFNNAAFTELTRMILKGTCHIKLDKISKFLSATLERIHVSLRENELVRWAIISFFFRSDVV